MVVLCCPLNPLTAYSYALLLFVADYRIINLYSHKFDSLYMTTWLSPIGIKSLASFYLLSQSFAAKQISYSLFALLAVGIAFSTYRTNHERGRAVTSKKNSYYQKILWSLLALFILIGGTYGV